MTYRRTYYHAVYLRILDSFQWRKANILLNVVCYCCLFCRWNLGPLLYTLDISYCNQCNLPVLLYNPWDFTGLWYLYRLKATHESYFFQIVFEYGHNIQNQFVSMAIPTLNSLHITISREKVTKNPRRYQHVFFFMGPHEAGFYLFSFPSHCS